MSQVGRITVGRSHIITVTADPTNTINSPIGTIAIATDASGPYYKIGGTSADWILLGLISVTYAQLTALIGSSGLIVGQNYLLTDFATRHEIPLSAISEVFATSTLLDSIIPSTGTSVQIGARNYDFDGSFWSNQDDGFIHATVGDAINADISREVDAIFNGIDTWDLTAILGGVAGNSIVTTVTPHQVGFSFPSGTLTGGADAIPNVVNTGSIEPLMLVANSTTTIYANVISTLFGQDELLYEVVDSTTAGGDKGRIYFRKDFNSNSTWYDWRVVLFRRWESAPLSGIYDQVFDNGGLFQDFFTFNNSAVALNCYNNVIGRASPSNIYVTDGLNNCVFNCPFYNVTTGLEFIWNTFIGDAFRDTTFGDNCIGNIISSGYFNRIGDNFQGNDIRCSNSTSAFHSNFIGHSFSGNTIVCLSGQGNSGGFRENRIGNDFSSNTITLTGGSFNNNAIGNTCQGNSIIGVGNFENNTMLNSFAFNIFNMATACSDNVIDEDMQSNTIGNDFRRNKVGYGFNSNSISDSCVDNVFKNNITSIIALTDFNNNIIDNEFFSVDFTLANLVYATVPSRYTKNISRRVDGSYRLWYIDATNTIIYNLPTD